MKYSFVILLISLGVCQGLFGSIGQAVNNIGNAANQLKTDAESTANQVKTHVESSIGQLLNIVNGIRFSAKFLWETVFNPTFDLIIQSSIAFRNRNAPDFLFLGGETVVDGQFGAIASLANTSITIPTNPLSDKYDQLTILFKSNIQHLYSQLFLLEQEAIKAIENGEVNFEERFRSFEQQLEAIKRQIEAWAEETKGQLEAQALTMADDLETIVDQYKQKIDSAVQAMEQIFENITKSLAKNFLDFVQSVVPNATNTIENLRNQSSLL